MVDIFQEDFFTRLTSIHFGRPLLVCFFDPPLPDLANFTPSPDVEYLGRHAVVFPEGGDPLFIYIVKVPTSFDGVVASTRGMSGDFSFGQQCAAILPTTGGDGDIAACINAVLRSITTTEISFVFPVVEGMLWMATLPTPPGGQVRWKFAFKKHRAGDNTSPLNVMAQCFPIGIAPISYTSGPSGTGGSSISFTYLGSVILGYRLDRKATGPKYKAPHEWSNDVYHTITPSGGDTTRIDGGIKFQPTMPLISADALA